MLAATCGVAGANEEIVLFDGENFDAFYTFLKGQGRDVDPDNVFFVEDGELVITGEVWGCLTTREEYDSYHLVAEYKWAGPTHGDRAEKARDSGILVHSVGEDGAYSGTWMYGLEVQIIEGGTGDLLVVADGSPEYLLSCPVAETKQGGSFLYDPSGKVETINKGRINWYGRSPVWTDTIDFRGEKDVEYPVGQWNRLECIVSGPSILVMLNGVLVNHAVDAKPTSGRIQIQSEGAEIRFRKIVLKPLGDSGE